ncbi:galacturonokinase [Phtheirospermum japonicum]|uniref:Galacturonokinase n=1 Tax=Phtheirospermum japonicum TaxID=374723 RepID=A0A830B5E7_9LAMI|nr:galacturonokinase [Phtheirospermum japonicum]
MGAMRWPSESELNVIRTKVAEMSGRDSKEVRVVVSPYRICPLGAHIDHQGGIVSAMTINKGILLGFVPSDDSQVLIQSAQFKGEVRFSVDEEQLPKSGAKLNDSSNCSSQEECGWGNYARGALYALQKRGSYIKQGIIGYICGAEGLDSSGLSSSAAVGVAYLLAFESANKLIVSPTENIEYDRLIENEYLGLKNGILDQSAILLSSYGCLTCMNCKTKEHKLIRSPESNGKNNETQKQFKILLVFSGLKQALISNPGYNSRVEECQEAAKVLLQVSGNEGLEPLLSNVDPQAYEEHKVRYICAFLKSIGFIAMLFILEEVKLDPNLARRAEHYFSENRRVVKGLEAWASGNIEEYGKLISASGLSSIQNYESGCEPLIQLYEILVKAPGVYGGRFSGAGFRGCCIAFVDADRALDAASFIRKEYSKLQPELASQIGDEDRMVLVCDAADCARLI